jgi:hypothetical protein
MIGEWQRVEGKTGLLFRIAEAALDNPEGIIREVLFPLVGESTLAALVRESQVSGPTFRHRIQTLIHRSYGHHYRRMLPLILVTLVFRSNNSAHRPVIDTLDWIKAHREDRRKLIACTEVPIDGVVRPQLQEILVEDGSDGERINRIDYEICALQVLRERLRCKEIWVEGADRHRNPDEDLPADFAANQVAYYQALSQPRDTDQFIERLQTGDARRPRCVERGLAPKSEGSTPCNRQESHRSHSPGPATGTLTTPVTENRGRPPLANDQPPGRGQGDRLACRLHRCIQDPS